MCNICNIVLTILKLLFLGGKILVQSSEYQIEKNVKIEIVININPKLFSFIKVLFVQGYNDIVHFCTHVHTMHNKQFMYSLYI